MREYGSVSIPQEALIAALRMGLKDNLSPQLSDEERSSVPLYDPLAGR